jgi:hypothetical protein
MNNSLHPRLLFISTRSRNGGDAAVSISGEGGIRTRVPLQETRFPSVRAKPDYATSPSLQTLTDYIMRV